MLGSFRTTCALMFTVQFTSSDIAFQITSTLKFPEAYRSDPTSGLVLRGRVAVLSDSELLNCSLEVRVLLVFVFRFKPLTLQLLDGLLLHVGTVLSSSAPMFFACTILVL